jgi:HEAT repeat protein
MTTTTSGELWSYDPPARPQATLAIERTTRFRSQLTDAEFRELAQKGSSELLERMRYMEPVALAAAVEALAYDGAKSAEIEARVLGCLDDKDRMVRERTARALIAFASQPALAKLVHVAERDTDPSVRKVAAETARLINAALT